MSHRPPFLGPWTCCIALLLGSLVASACSGDVGPSVEEDFKVLSRSIGRALGRSSWAQIELRVVPDLVTNVQFGPDDAGEAALAKKLRWQAGPLWVSPSHVPGKYEPSTGAVVVRGDGGRPSTRYTLAHELVHAHRHGKGDYDRLYLPTETPSRDRVHASRCLLEGDAMLLGSFFANTPIEEIEDRLSEHAETAEDLRQSSEAFLATPAWTLEDAVYFAGFRFALAVFERDGLDGLRQAFRHPPQSTEQILHPEKYGATSPDIPVVFARIEPPEGVLEASERLAWGTLGEFDVLRTLAPVVGQTRASVAAAGWDGAGFSLHGGGGRPEPVFLMVSRWDSEQDASEFAAAWMAWAQRRDGAESEPRPGPPPPGQVVELRTDEGIVAVRWEGMQVTVLDGVSADEADGLVDVVAKTSAYPRELSPPFNPFEDR